MEFKDKLRFLRKSNGLTQTDVGNLLGVEKYAVSKYECGVVKNLPFSTLEKLADLFHVKVAYLVDDSIDAPDQLQIKTYARWMDGKCTNCGWQKPAYISQDGHEMKKWGEPPFCPICGADMSEKQHVSAVVMECPSDEGYTSKDVRHLLDIIQETSEAEVLPIRLEADNSEAFGFIRMDDADMALDFRIEQDSEFGKAICAILNDKSLETSDGIYNICGLQVQILQKEI